MTLQDIINSGRRFICPADCLAAVAEVFSNEGDYPLHMVRTKSTSPRIIDIGANVGAFTLYAKCFWPDATVHAYEPNPGLQEYLRANVGDLGGVTIHEQAVWKATGHTTLWSPNVNPRLRGFCADGVESVPSSDEIPVECVAIHELPRCDIMKMDIEAGEGDLLTMLHPNELPQVLMVEYHTEFSRIQIDNALIDTMRLTRLHVTGDGIGQMMFARRVQGE